MSQHGIKVVTTKTGLSPHVIRVWEKRYNAVTPDRTDTNRRLYSDDDLERLVLLADLTRHGHTIGQIANLPNTELTTLHQSLLQDAPPEDILAPELKDCQAYINAAFTAIVSIDLVALENTLDKAIKKIGYSGLLEKVLIPLITSVGAAWHSGKLTAAEEHATSSFIKDYLCVSARSFSYEEHAPSLIVTTPSGQLHELGAVIAASQARKLGWKVIYLGSSLPADEIAGAAEKAGAAAVLLSIIYPADDPNIEHQLIRLRKQLGTTPIIVGGSATESYKTALNEIKAIQLSSITELTRELSAIRNQITEQMAN